MRTVKGQHGSDYVMLTISDWGSVFDIEHKHGSDYVILTISDWGSVFDIEHKLFDCVGNLIRRFFKELLNEISDPIAVLFCRPYLYSLNLL